MNILTTATEHVAVGTLTPMPGNARRGDVGAIAASLQTNGQYRPIVVASDDVILAGNHTWQAAVQLGWAEIAVTRVAVPHTDPLARRIVVADNRTSDLAHDDPAALAELLEAIERDAGTLDGTGFDDAALAELLAGMETPDADEWADTLGELPDGDRAPFQQKTFTLHDKQAEAVERAIAEAKGMGPFVDSPNENSNGNALARVCEMFLMWNEERAA